MPIATCILQQEVYHATDIGYGQVSIRMPSNTSDTDYGPRKRATEEQRMGLPELGTRQR